MEMFSNFVPKGKALSIDWCAIEDAFDWFRALDGCPQDPVFHAEGDVNRHTRLVTEALVAEPTWGSRGDGERAMLFWAALLHDVAKPETTRTDDNARVKSPGHARRGQIMARQILWRMGAPYLLREQICHLITHHQVPLHLWDRDDPERRIHAISYQTRCDLLVALARADVMGRVCPDHDRLLDNVALFQEIAREEGCLSTPKVFPSPHSRFLYFRKPGRSPTYEAFDDWQGAATLLSGLPTAGKDRWLAKHSGDRVVVSLDELRNELNIEPTASQGPIVTVARGRARAALRAGAPLIWNATNLSRDIRRRLIDLFADYRAKVSMIYFETSAAEAHRRNAERERPVPERAMARMLEHWEPPDLTECHDLEILFT
jgi:predicted kinase